MTKKIMESNPKNHYLIPLGLAATMAIGLGLGFMLAPRTNYTFAEKKGEKYQKIQDILEVLDKRYVDPIDSEKLFEESIGQMLHQLDPHSNYIPAAELKRAQESIEGKFGGVGVRFFILQDTVCITHVVKGSPSEKAGVKAGDKILEVDGTKVAGKKISNDKVMEYLKGEENTDVEVVLLRNGKKVETEITRGSIPISSIGAAYMLDNKTGFIQIEQFSVTTSNEFKRAALMLLQKGMTQMILDLRNNGGGVLSGAIEIADEFLPGNLEIVKTKGSNTRNEVYRSKSGGLLEKIQVAVLINQYSASASEIVAGALQDNDRATIYGRRSFGKGLVQGDFPLRDGSNLRLTVARYYTPTGRCIQKPYSGSMEEYYGDASARYDNGELFAPDSTIFVDSLRYKTKKGKTVYGGGGIMPDVFIPLDTMAFTPYYNRLRFSGAFQGFAFQFVSDKRAKWATIEEYLSTFRANKELLRQFVYFASEEYAVPYTLRDISANQRTLEIQLKAEIARQLWLEEGFYQVYNTVDTEVKSIKF
ncbi:MAG: S41 family peptidase [Bacteroidetes bacterium]|nr:S41 family peptidase [Bacteroidota bacterium]